MRSSSVLLLVLVFAACGKAGNSPKAAATSSPVPVVAPALIVAEPTAALGAPNAERANQIVQIYTVSVMPEYFTLRDQASLQDLVPGDGESAVCEIDFQDGAIATQNPLASLYPQLDRNRPYAYVMMALAAADRRAAAYGVYEAKGSEPLVQANLEIFNYAQPKPRSFAANIFRYYGLNDHAAGQSPLDLGSVWGVGFVATSLKVPTVADFVHAMGLYGRVVYAK